jgi:peptide/nickel transport system permease protein
MRALVGRIARLIVSSVLLFIAVITVLFLLLELAPGNPIQSLVGDVPISPAFEAQITAAFGLDKPVLELILGRAGNTLALAVPSFLISTTLGIILGSIAARTRRRWLDGGISGAAVALFSVPNFWLGMMLIMIFSLTLGWLPTQGKAPYGQEGIALQYMVLPIITMATSEVARTSSTPPGRKA